MRKKMAYCSDLHLDFFFGPTANIRHSLDYHLSKYFVPLDSDVLIIAGDTSHFTPEDEVAVLLELKAWLCLKEIIIVNGNHSGYLIGGLRARFKNGLQLMSYRTDLYNINGIHALEGNFVEVDGVRIGGCDSFYDGTIYYRNNTGWYNSSGGIESFWKRAMNDASRMRLDSFHEFAKQQKDLLKGLKNQVDVMVTHVKPVVGNKYFAKEYQGDTTNAFYSFDYEEELAEDTRLSHWIYGHTHTVEEFDFFGKKLLANPRGYPGEHVGKTIQHFEVIK